MYRVMIIDDERALRELLKHSIKWEELGFVIAGEAASGIEAINTIDEIQPHLVMVDIRMPFMDGIEFSKLAIQRYPQLKIIVLTAYDDFTYAKDCIGIGVCEYLLKPIVRADIQEALKKVAERLKKETPVILVQQMDKKNVKISSIKQYIGEHYDNTDLNLNSIAQHFGFNASYLSRMFKTETGDSLIDFLTCYRMEIAKEYARKDSMMYVTAKLVGIPDPNYFGKCFKKYQGISYSEYQRKC